MLLAYSVYWHVTFTCLQDHVSSSNEGGSNKSTILDNQSKHATLTKWLVSTLVFACTTSTSNGCSVCDATTPPPRPPPSPTNPDMDLATSVPTMYCEPNTLSRSPARFSVTPTLITRRSRFAASTRDVPVRRTNRRASRRCPHVHTMDMAEATRPNPGRKNLLAILPSSSGVAAACASMTLRAKRKVTALMTVSTSWDHQEIHEHALSLWEVRAMRGSMPLSSS